jgi:hypothetical protein
MSPILEMTQPVVLPPVVLPPVVLNVDSPKSRKNNKPLKEKNTVKTNTKKVSMNVNKRKLLIVQDEVEPEL